MKTQRTESRICAGLLVALVWVGPLVVDLHAQSEARKYDLKLKWKAVEGHKSEISDDETQVFKMSIQADGQVLNQSEDSDSTSLVATGRVERVEDGNATRWKWEFSKALRHGKEGDAPLAFQGKTVIGTLGADGKRNFVYEDGEPLDPADAAVLKNFNGNDKANPGEPTGEEIFVPKTPVAVGESWSPDVSLMAKGLGGSLLDAVDLSQSNAKGTLKSVTVRDGVEFGEIEVEVNLSLTKFGPVQLDKPVLFHGTGHINACLDGTLPDGVMTMHMDAKGDREARVPGNPRKMDLSLDMEADGRRSVRTLK